MMVCDSKLPAARFPRLESVPFVDGSLFKTLERVYGCPVERAERCVEAAQVLDKEVASLLQVPHFAPILLMTGVALDREKRPVECMTAYVKEGVVFQNAIESSHNCPSSDAQVPSGRGQPQSR